MTSVTNASLIGVIVRTGDNKTSRIVGNTPNGYMIEGASRIIPADHLIRRGKILVEIPKAEMKKIPAERIVMLDGYAHIHPRAAQRRIKKGETVDLPAPVAFDDWRRSTKLIETKVEKPAAAKAKKAAVKKPAAKPAKADAAKKKKPVPKRVKVVPVAERSTPIDRQFETAEQLFSVMQTALTNPRTWKEFNEALSKSLNVDVADLPDTASAIVEKYGVPKVRKALTALNAMYKARIAEQSLPRHLKDFANGSGKLSLNKNQVKAVIAALAPTVSDDVLPHVIERFFNAGEFELVRKNRKAPKVSGDE